ncbi:MAG: hypothetical protein LBP80_00725 [Treponema sp.]|jgi:hypothetical protein|nr:hypothetical protein [Treponema sp.]
MRRFLSAGILFALILAAPLSAQDFGFGFDDGEDSAASFDGGGSGPSVAVNGEVSSSMTGYIDDFSEGASHVKPGDIFSGKLNFSANVSAAEGVIKLKLKPSENPVSIDEAYVRAYFGSFDIEGGLRKLTWGKADSFGPLDVINPLDTSEIYPAMADNNDLMGLKIARPLIHASLRLGQFSKLEGVFVPNFEPYRFAESGRWVPAQMKLLSSYNVELVPPDMATLEYAQAGLRFTTTLGPSDLGVQYYYGRLTQPAVNIVIGQPVRAELLYNPYHQVGIDYAQVIFGFNIRAEFAANITEDLEGDDGSVYNPALAWSLGFDRDLFLGINLNVQANETIRLMNDKLGSGDFVKALSGGFDIEGGKDMTATRITATLSRKFLRDEFELRAAAVWGVEDQDFVVMPALIWTKGDVKIACSGGIFGGDEEGQLGQYRDNHFVKIGIAYTF